MNDSLVLLCLILCNGLFAMSEIALLSTKKLKLQNAAKRGSRAARIALKLSENPDRFLSTVQIGITLIGILTGIYSSDALAQGFGDQLVAAGLDSGYAYQLAQGLIVVVVTYLSIVLGELVPKRIGICLADRTATAVAWPMYILSLIAMPFVWLLSKSTQLLIKLLGIKSEENQVTEEEIMTLIEEGTASGVVQEVEQDIMERTFMLGDMDIESIMTRRQDVVMLHEDMPYTEVASVVRDTPFEIYPIKSTSNEDIIGAMTLKDFGRLSLSTDLFPRDVMSNPVYFPENMSVYRALESMKEQNLSRVFVCDEFGEFVGIITLKDMLEALVGTLSEEDKQDIREQDDGSWTVDGQCPYHDFLLHFDIDDADAAEYNTVSGLVLDQLERIPQAGDTIEWRGMEIGIAKMDGIRIDQLRVKRL